MRLKSYFAASVEEAMRKARRELGDEAMLVNSRRALPEAAHFGNYEVVFAIQGEAAQPEPLADRTSGDLLAKHIDELRTEIARLTFVVQSQHSGSKARDERPNDEHTATLHPWSEEVYKELTLADVEAEIALDVVRRLNAVELAADPDRTAQMLRQKLAELVVCAPSPRPSDIITLVGPPGAGKTLLAEKLAAHFISAGRDTATILAYGGSRRVWSWPSSASARTLDAAATPDGFRKKLALHLRKGRVIVDTPGFSPDDDLESLAAALDGLSGLQLHLVVPATARINDLLAMVRRFRAINAHYLAFTHLDEATSHGNVLTASCRSRLPVGYLSAGQSLNDLFAPSPDVVVGLVLGDRTVGTLLGRQSERAAAHTSSGR